MAVRICHMTSVHERIDTRIFLKQCRSLKEEGYEVHLIVSDGNGADCQKDIHIHDVGRVRSRLSRFSSVASRILKTAIDLNAEIYHFHDPELMRIGLKLVRRGKKVIYDVHEDLPRQIKKKPYLNIFFRTALPFLIEWYESYAAKRLSYIITATPFIEKRFLRYNRCTININNYPLISELFSGVKWSEKKNKVCFIGGISAIRGINQLIEAMRHINGTLELAGEFEHPSDFEKVSRNAGWNNVQYYGFVSRTGVRKILNEVKVGIIPFLPVPNHINSQPNKIFEYMSAGIPVVGSNFPQWKDIIEGTNGGICVDPEKPEELARAVNYLLENDADAQLKGNNARKAVKEYYHWELERRKLYKVYHSLLKNIN